MFNFLPAPLLFKFFSFYFLNFFSLEFYFIGVGAGVGGRCKETGNEWELDIQAEKQNK